MLTVPEGAWATYEFHDFFIGIQSCRHCFHSFERFSQRISSFGGKETLHENVVVEVLVPLVDDGVAFSPSAGILTTLVGFWSSLNES